MNLTWYHREFLAHLCQCSAPHIIIGGQARAFHFGTETSDLDILMPIDNSINSPVHNALVEWSERYPHHTETRICKPFSILEETQIIFPDTPVSVLTDTDEVLEIPDRRRIDVLFFVEGLDFEKAYSRSTISNEIDTYSKILGKQDLDKT